MTDYDEIRIIFPTSALADHPSLQQHLDTIEQTSGSEAEVEVLQSGGRELTYAMWYDTSTERPKLLDLLETVHVPYDAIYFENSLETTSETRWYRPNATPDHGQYDLEDDQSATITWEAIVALAGNHSSVPLSALRQAAHLPPSDLLQHVNSKS